MPVLPTAPNATAPQSAHPATRGSRCRPTNYAIATVPPQSIGTLLPTSALGVLPTAAIALAQGAANAALDSTCSTQPRVLPLAQPQATTPTLLL